MRPPAGLLILFMLGAGNASLAADVKPSLSDARPSMPFSGTATMRDDGSLTLHLRLDSTGKRVDDTLTYKTTDRGYDDVLRHLGSLDPGDSKDFDPWKD
jgi:hypothetical protein